MGNNKEPRIVLFDLETLPNLKEALKVWPMLSDFPGQTLRASITSIICFGYKVFGEAGANCINAWDFSAWNKNINDDGPLVRKAYSILENADCVVTHNGIRFDWKYFQTRCAFHGLKPLPKIPHVDTCQLAKSHLYLFRNNLKHLAKFFETEDKIDTGGWDLWVRVHNKEEAAMRDMSNYCIGDVIALEQIFKKLRPFASNIPNYNQFHLKGSKKACPSCGSTRIFKNGMKYTKTMSYQRYTCKDCGSNSRTDVKDLNPRSI